MKVVIVGAWNRPEKDDAPLVNELMTALAKLYPDLKIITGGCDRGVGKIVKNRCCPADRKTQQEFDWLECNIRIFYDHPNKSVLAQIWAARNAFFAEMGEEFHIFMDAPHGQGGGAMQDLLDRVMAANLPYSLYYPGKDLKPKLFNQ